MEYRIKKPLGACAICGVEFALGDALYSSILLEAAEPARRDFCVQCFQKVERAPDEEFAYWKTRRTVGEAKKRVIDFPTLRSLFFRMAEHSSPEYRKLTYLLGLLLLRKKFLQLHEFTSENGVDFVIVSTKERPEPLKIEAPSLAAAEFGELRERLRLLLDVDIEEPEGEATTAEASADENSESGVSNSA